MSNLAALLKVAVSLTAALAVSCATSGRAPESQLVGRWRSSNGAQTAEYVFSANGRFDGSVASHGRTISEFTGKWSLRADGIDYEYTKDKFGTIPAGTKDRDRILSIAADHFVIVAADGTKRKYVRD
jgi:phage-related protein